MDFRKLLDSLLVTPMALSKATGTSRQFIYKVMRGEKGPGPETLAAWAKALRVTQKALRAAIAETRRRAGK